MAASAKRPRSAVGQLAADPSRIPQSTQKRMNVNEQPDLNEVRDLVAQLAHNPVADYRSAVFQCHASTSVRSKTHLYSIKNWSESNPKVVHLGREAEQSDCGFDYAIAVVNKRTRLVDYVPAKLVVFEATYAENPELLFSRRPPPVDYTADYTITKETWADKRRALTSEFGSAKKLKAQDAAVRRQIKNETLAVMMSSAVDSTSKTEDSVDVKEEMPISLINKAVSSVLPVANEAATAPADVYSFELFLSDEEVDELKEESLEFLKQPKSDLIDNGFPELVYRMRGAIGGSEKKACLLILLATMVQSYQIVGKPPRKGFSIDEWSSLHYPSGYRDKLQQLFFAGDLGRLQSKDAKSRSRVCLFVNPAEKDRLLAHILCLALLFDQENLRLPITKWTAELKTTEAKIVKMATALGCSVATATPEEGVLLGTTRVARLAGVPSLVKKKAPFRRFRK